MLAKEFCEKHKITISSVSAPLKKTDPKDSFRYVVTVNYAGRAHTVDFWKGSSGHVGIRVLCGQEYKDGNYVSVYKWKRLDAAEIQKRKNTFSYLNQPKPIPPEADEVLYSLAMDCLSVHNSPFWEDFANDLGYNPDSIKDRKVYKACVKSYRQLRKMFGPEVLEEFMSVEDV